MTDWDDAFENSAYIAGAETFPPLWQQRAADYRAGADFGELNLSYGEHEREALDIFWPTGTPKGLAMFVHGGYWLQFDRSYWSDLAEGARQHGWAVALPSYTLAPEASISEITRQIGRAVSFAAGRVDGPIRLTGHSAGGHLVARMACQDGPLAGDIVARLDHVMPISGLHDLRPLRNTRMNTDLNLSEAEATSESPCLSMPHKGLRITPWVGGDERPEFLRQNALLAGTWGRVGADIHPVVDPGHNHFTVIAGLADPASLMTRAFVDSD